MEELLSLFFNSVAYGMDIRNFRCIRSSVMKNSVFFQTLATFFNFDGHTFFEIVFYQKCRNLHSKK